MDEEIPNHLKKYLHYSHTSAKACLTTLSFSKVTEGEGLYELWDTHGKVFRKSHKKNLEQEVEEVNYSVENDLMGKEKRSAAIYRGSISPICIQQHQPRIKGIA